MKRSSSGALVSIYLSEQNSCCMQPTNLILMLCPAYMWVCVCEHITWISMCLRPAMNFTCFCPKLGQEHVAHCPAEPGRRAAFLGSSFRLGNISWSNLQGEGAWGTTVNLPEASRTTKHTVTALEVVPDRAHCIKVGSDGRWGRPSPCGLRLWVETAALDPRAVIISHPGLPFFFFSLLLILSWDFNACVKTPLPIICASYW